MNNVYSGQERQSLAPSLPQQHVIKTFDEWPWKNKKLRLKQSGRADQQHNHRKSVYQRPRCVDTAVDWEQSLSIDALKLRIIIWQKDLPLDLEDLPNICSHWWMVMSKNSMTPGCFCEKDKITPEQLFTILYNWRAAGVQEIAKLYWEMQIYKVWRNSQA